MVLSVKLCVLMVNFAYVLGQSMTGTQYFHPNTSGMTGTQYFHPNISENIAQINDVITPKLPCFRSTIKICIQNLMTFLTEDSPHFVPANELDDFCSRATEGQKCMKEYLDFSNCIIPNDTHVFEAVMERSELITDKICKGHPENLSYRKSYKKTTDCINKNVEEITKCMKTSIKPMEFNFQLEDINMTRSEKYSVFCCSMVQYIDCAGRAIKDSCDKEAKYVATELLLTASGAEFNDFCRSIDVKYPYNTALCSSASSVNKFGAFLSSMTIDLFIWYILVKLFGNQ
ncbi:uncharacterized protein LOC129216643 [Uloborus diversus]|uniref:uncharacterized protein LOC129216643 n=1 Tax=Uloborus diversus TaxID=327109 RepID=UPI00240A2CC6|nr:uncharacterized protein LOC129216643 [Uloborus diversus]